MGRAPCCDQNGLKKGPWTPEEDLKLTNYIQKHGPGNWRDLPKNAGLHRCGKSCRLRWTNYLRPDIKRGRFSFEEEETIIQLHSVLGNKWSAIAARLPGRTDNEIKNYWNTHIRKRLLRMGIDPVTHAPRLDLMDLSSILNAAAAGSSLCNPSLLNLSSLLGTQALFNPEFLRLASTLLSLNHNSNNNINAKQENINHELFNPHNLQQNLSSQTQIPPSTQPINYHDLNQFQTKLQGLSTENATTITSTQVMIQAAPNIVDHDHQGLSSSSTTATNMTNNVVRPISTQENTTTTSSNNINPPSAGLNENAGPQPSYVNCGSINTDMTNPTVGDLPDQSSFLHNLILDDYYSNNKGFGFDSVMSTPSSSPTDPNSVSSKEDDRDLSYCSNLFKFEIPDSLDINDLL